MCQRSHYATDNINWKFIPKRTGSLALNGEIIQNVHSEMEWSCGYQEVQRRIRKGVLQAVPPPWNLSLWQLRDKEKEGKWKVNATT